MTPTRLAPALLAVALNPALAAARTSFPMVAPVAVQRGTAAEVTVDCRTSSLFGAYKVLVEGPGVAAEVVPAKDARPADPNGPPPVVASIKLKVTVAADAKIDAAAVAVVGTADATDEAGRPVALTRTAVAVEEIYAPGGGRARFDAGMQAVAVTRPSDLLQVKVKPNRITLKPGDEVKIDVEVVRRPDYDKGLTLDVQLRHLGSVFGNPLPPGVTTVDGKSKTLAGTGTSGGLVLKAAPDAPECADVPVCVQGYVPINFVVKIGYASEPILVTVET